MIALSISELAKICGGKVLGDAKRLNFQGLEYDSRELRGGELFVALAGLKSHGHEFVQQAYEKGAAAFLVEDEKIAAKFPAEKGRFVIVTDTLKAFWELAAFWRRETGVPLVAITGSVGKTTVKEMTAALLLKKGRGIYSLKSHNNHVGVPYTICRLSKEHKWAVIEIGMNHKGEISALSKIASPDSALITKIAPAHIENFSSLQEITAAKMEILEGLKPGGQLMLNADDPELLWAGKDLEKKFIRRYFGQSDLAEARVSNIRDEHLQGLKFRLTLKSAIDIEMPIIGSHNALNAAAATLAALSLFPDLSNEEIKHSLAEFKAPLMRLNLIDLPGNRKIIDDSYNANPESMRASIGFAHDLIGSGKRVGLLVGDMLELGAFAEKYHDEVAQFAATKKLAFVVAIGDYSKCWTLAAQKSGIPAYAAKDPEAAAEIVAKQSFDIVLVKASRGQRLDLAVKKLVGSA